MTEQLVKQIADRDFTLIDPTIKVFAHTAGNDVPLMLVGQMMKERVPDNAMNNWRVYGWPSGGQGKKFQCQWLWQTADGAFFGAEADANKVEFVADHFKPLTFITPAAQEVFGNKAGETARREWMTAAWEHVTGRAPPPVGVSSIKETKRALEAPHKRTVNAAKARVRGKNKRKEVSTTSPQDSSSSLDALTPVKKKCITSEAKTTGSTEIWRDCEEKKKETGRNVKVAYQPSRRLPPTTPATPIVTLEVAKAEMNRWAEAGYPKSDRDTALWRESWKLFRADWLKRNM